MMKNLTWKYQLMASGLTEQEAIDKIEADLQALEPTAEIKAAAEKSVRDTLTAERAQWVAEMNNENSKWPPAKCQAMIDAIDARPEMAK